MTVKNTWATGEAVTAADLNALATEANAGTKRTVVTVSASQTLAALTDTDYIVLVTSAGAPVLPTAVNNKSRYTIKNISTVNRTIATTSAQTIDGVTSILIRADQSVDVISDNANWRLI